MQMQGVEFVFQIKHVKTLLEGMRELKLKGKAADDLERIKETYCLIRSQMIGPLKELAPFMRNEEWLKKEIGYEEADGPKKCRCSTCGQPSRGWKCARCWKERAVLIHGLSGHVCRVSEVGQKSGVETEVGEKVK